MGSTPIGASIILKYSIFYPSLPVPRIDVEAAEAEDGACPQSVTTSSPAPKDLLRSITTPFPMGELNFYSKFHACLRLGCDEIYERVHINGKYETDLVGVKHYKHRPPRLTIIEVKESQFPKVVTQAYMRLLFAHRVYVGLAWKKDYRDFGYALYTYGQNWKTMRDAGIGFYLYDEARDQTWGIFGAKEQGYRPSFEKTFEAIKKMTPVWREEPAWKTRDELKAMAASSNG